MICSYGISLPPVKLYVLFMRNFEKVFLKLLMCSSTFCLFWKIYMCSSTIFGYPGKFDVFLLIIISSPGELVLEISFEKAAMEKRAHLLAKCWLTASGL